MDDNPKKDEQYASYTTRAVKISRPSKAVKPKLGNSGKRIGILAVPVISLLFGIGGGWLGARIYENDLNRTVSTAAKQRFISNESELISEIAKNVGQSVVSINVQSNVSSQDIFGFTQTNRQASAGTGFIIDEKGIILTNRHVVPAGTTRVGIILADGTRFDNVEILGRTSESSPLDVAFLKINDLNGKKLNRVTIGDSSKIKVGDRVVAIGNALGQFQNTVTSGIVSGYGRDITAGDESGNTGQLNDLIQTDTAINAGNSGGPLVNINGEVVGVNTAVAGGAQNIGFAIPINDTKGLISSILDTGEIRQPYLGVRYVSLTDDLAFQYNVSVKRGAYIIPSASGEDPSVLPGSPAEKAGLKEKDVILKVNSANIDDKTSLNSALSRFKVGDKINLQISRAGKTQTIQVTLGALPPS